MANQASAAGPYNQEGQIHCLSSITNAAFGLDFASVAAMNTYVSTVINDTLTQDQQGNYANGVGCNYLGTPSTAWTVAWGPVAYSHTSSVYTNASPVVADNTMALYYNASQKLYVVGIAGTNAISMFGWEDEDFVTSTTTTWNQVSIPSMAADDAVIADGTKAGLQILLGLTDTNGNTLQQGLYAALGGQTGQTLAVAGHSLGGALTPVMALYLAENGSTWDNGGAVTSIGAYPTAGPTPGDSNFADFYQGLLTTGVNGVAFTFLAKYNTIDVVPQAWELDTMVTIPFLYDPTGSNPPAPTTPTDVMIASLTTGIIGKSFNTNAFKFNGYTQICKAMPQRVAMTGTYVTPSNLPGDSTIVLGLAGLSFLFEITSALAPLYDNNNPNNSNINYTKYMTNFGYFLLEAAYQHTTAYSQPNMLIPAGTIGFITEYLAIKGTVTGSGPAPSDYEIAAKQLLSKHVGLANIGKLAVVQQSAIAAAN